MKTHAILLLGLLALTAFSSPIPQFDMETEPLDEECDELDAQPAIAEPLDEMRFFPEMEEAMDEINEDEDCEEEQEVEEPAADYHYAAAGMAGQNSIDYMVDEECEDEQQDESEEYAFGHQDADEVFPMPDQYIGGEGEAVDLEDCEGDEAVDEESDWGSRSDFGKVEDLGILENADFAKVDESAVRMLDGEGEAEEIEECEEEY